MTSIQNSFLNSFYRIGNHQRFYIESKQRGDVQNALEGARYLLGESSWILKSIDFDDQSGVLTYRHIPKFDQPHIHFTLLANKKPEKTFGPSLPEPKAATFIARMAQMSPLKGVVRLFSVLQESWGSAEYQCLFEDLNPGLGLNWARYQALFCNSDISLEVTVGPLEVERNREKRHQYHPYRPQQLQNFPFEKGVPDFQKPEVRFVAKLLRNEDSNSFRGHKILGAALKTFADRLPESALRLMTMKQEWWRGPTQGQHGHIYCFTPSEKGGLVFDITNSILADRTIACTLGIDPNEEMETASYKKR